ncbi:MAG: DUF4337 family protein [Candidatus Caenarcaniphilales bacterium]|nr:DUF4337 family protein [Candidatus Caenarcaniphilales bacterium]
MDEEESQVIIRGKPGTLILLLLISFLILFTNYIREQSLQNVQIFLSMRNNLWDHYGNKSIKSKLYEIEKNNFVFHTNDIEDLSQLAITKSLIANLDHEIARYKKEKFDIQEDALNADTKYELAKRQHSIYLTAFSIAVFSLLLVVCSILTILDNILVLKIASIILTLISVGFTGYGIWLM